MVRRATWFASHRLWPAGGASSICREWQTDFLALLGCGAFICLVGLLDDIWRLSAWKKLIAQFAGALVLASNLIDGLDGLAAGVAAIACGVIAVFAHTTGQMVMIALMLALLGSLSGFSWATAAACFSAS